MITENTLEVEGKTGHASYRLDPQIREMLLSIAASKRTGIHHFRLTQRYDC